MRIVQLTPGSGDSFYCENCLRDAELVRAMRDLGHDVLMVPMYLPLQADRDQAVSNAPIFFGGINVYLQQKSAFFRKTPRWLDRLFDLPALLRLVGRKAGMTSSEDLSRTTVSMLRGEQGRQVKELERLLAWLELQESRPDVVCLSNALLAGLAKGIKERLGVPVLCLLQDEDAFLDGLGPPYADQAWQILAERCREVDTFIAVSRYYADAMQQRLGLNSDRVHVVYTGISLEGYELVSEQPEVPTIGYLSRMCSEKGLDTLVDAFIGIKKNEKLKNARLRIAGGKSGHDEPFIARLKKKLDSCGLNGDVEFLSDFGREAKLAFLQTLSVLSVPEKQPIAFGLYVLEAFAAGVPVVQPAHGVFPELLEMTGGGVLFEPNNVEALAAAIEPLLLDLDLSRRLGRQGREAVIEKLSVEQTARQIVRIYKELCVNLHK